MEIIRRIYKQSAFILIPLAVISAFFEWRKLPLSILIGGGLAVANLKGLAWGVQGLVGTGQQATGMLVFFSLIRLFILIAVIVILLWLKIINIAGIFIGFTAVLILLLKEGVRSARDGG
ncbi:MAG: hypothetical protein EPN94_09220 [Nitrospirae bacterium]|nr:MAG: hypothetical protein EPN94_09220 [Nitrospirota bacterium]